MKRYAVHLLILTLSASLATASSSCQATDSEPWSAWSAWTQECTGRLADQFPSDAPDLRDKASAVSQFSTRQRPCRCVANDACPQVLVELRWRDPPPALRRYLAVDCAWCNWDAWNGACSSGDVGGCRQSRRRDCLCRPDNRSLYTPADARKCSLGWAIDAKVEWREIGNFSLMVNGRQRIPTDSNGSGGGWLFGDLTSAFPDVFKAVFVLVALVIALISCRGLCILVQSRFGDSGSLDSIYRPGPDEPADECESRPFADPVGESLNDEDDASAPMTTTTVLDIDAYTASGELIADVRLRSPTALAAAGKVGRSSQRGSYPDPLTCSHPLSVVHEPLDEEAEAELDGDEDDDDDRADDASTKPEPSTIPKQQPVSFVEAALVTTRLSEVEQDDTGGKLEADS